MRKFLPYSFIHTALLGFILIPANLLYARYPDPKSASGKQQDYDISYSIEPFYDINVLRFIVVMEFKGDKSGETKINLPTEYGSQNTLSSIKFLKALSENTTIIDTEKPEFKTIKYTPNSTVKIYYQIEESRLGDVELGNQYMLILRKQYFNFLGETFFILPVWEGNAELTFKLAWNHMPSTWNLANSFGANDYNQTVTLPLWKFRYSIFTGGDYRIIKRNVGKYPLYISIRDNFSFSDNQIADLVVQIVKDEREFWNDFEFPYYLVSISALEGKGDQAGTGRTNSYDLFLSRDRQIDYRLKRTVAREIFHAWVGDKMNYSQPEQLVYWFKEGFCDYYARLILLRSNLIGLNEYIDDYNNVLQQYYTSGMRYEKNERLVKEFWSDPDLTKLPYQRGDIIAHNLNTVILKNSKGRKSLDDMMREILKRCTTESLKISSGTLSAMIRYYAGDQPLAEIMRSLNSGVALKASPDALGPCITMQIDSYKRFWIIGEQYDVPVYQLKNENLANEKSCVDWFGVNK